MSINKIIIDIMVIFAVIGGVDKMLGNRFGFGREFEKGIMAMGTLAISMIGIIALAPVIADVLGPVVVPVFNLLGADPAMFAGSILANDMGGAVLAGEMAVNPQAGLFGGLIVGAMLGPTIDFTIPVALGMIRAEDRRYFATGVLAGIITIPVGAFAGGLAAGFPVIMLLRNLIPIILFAALIAIGLWRFEKAIVKGFTWFGKLIMAISVLGFVLGIVNQLTGITIIKNMNPLSEGFEIVADIAIVLAGAFPLVLFITRVLKKPLMKMGMLLGINETAAAGMVASLANSIPMFGMMKDMDTRGKIVNVAFAVSASLVFGDHLGFTAGYNAEMIFPMIVGKLTGGVTAVMIALFISGKMIKTENCDVNDINHMNDIE